MVKRTAPMRVLVGKVGLDGHDRGIKVIARGLRDAGMEVIYLGVHNTPEEIVRSAVQEDVDAIGLSIHSAAHMTLLRRVLDLLKEENAEEIALFAGGIIPDEDVAPLRAMGVREIFLPGADLPRIIERVQGMRRRG